MDILSTVVVGLAFFLAFLAVLRTIPNRRFLTIFFLLLPLAYFSYRWSIFRNSREELLVGIASAVGIIILWWLSWGRRLSPPDDSNIRVWTKEDPFE